MKPALIMVTTSFPIAGDGSEAAGGFVADLAEELAHEVPVRVVAPGRSSGRETWAPGVEVFRYAAPAQALSTLRPWRPRELLDILRVLREGRAAVREAVRAGPAAHVFALWALPSGHWARTARLPYSVWTLGSDIWSLGRLPGVRAWLRRVLAGAAHRYSDGHALARDTRAICRREVAFLPSTRAPSAPRPVPRRRVPPFRLLFLGRWHPNKGADLLLEALGQLDDEDWSRIECVTVCGGGPLEALVRDGVAALQARARPLRLQGFLDKQAAARELAGADIVLIPSRVESIPVIFSDAVKAGCAVAAMPVGDLPTLIDAEHPCGMVADAVSSSAFAAMLSRMLLAPGDAFDAGIAARASEFSLDRVAARLRRDLLGSD